MRSQPDYLACFRMSGAQAVRFSIGSIPEIRRRKRRARYRRGREGVRPRHRSRR